MNALAHKVANSFEFGPFLLIPEQQLLLENEKAVRIGARALILLTALVQRHGEVVGKRELLSLVWPGIDVDEGNLKVTIAAIRLILGKASDSPNYIATVFGRGYQFIETVRNARPYPQAHYPTAASCSSSSFISAKRIFGREDAINSILHELKHARLISIVGPGGVGKTTLALEVIDRAARVFKGGASLVDLSLLEEVSQVEEAIAEAIRTHVKTGDKSDGVDILLVIDNCEHLIDTVAKCVDQILTTTRTVKLLATSREPMSIRGERVRRLCGLDLPTQIEKITAEEALAFPAIQLFVERATEKLKSFRLSDLNAPAIAAICHRLEGHALSIERVSLRVGVLGVVEMLDHIDRRFHMFDGYHEGPERHRTLTASVNASYALLSPNQQAIMRRLSTFEGTFDLESARIIGGAEGSDPAEVVEDIACLVAKSLLSTEVLNGEVRYRQSHVARAFALEEQRAHLQQAQVQRRHPKRQVALLEGGDVRAAKEIPFCGVRAAPSGTGSR